MAPLKGTDNAGIYGARVVYPWLKGHGSIKGPIGGYG